MIVSEYNLFSDLSNYACFKYARLHLVSRHILTKAHLSISRSHSYQTGDPAWSQAKPSLLSAGTFISSFIPLFATRIMLSYDTLSLLLVETNVFNFRSTSSSFVLFWTVVNNDYLIVVIVFQTKLPTERHYKVPR